MAPGHGETTLMVVVTTERGASSAEYALLLALVAAVVLVALARLGTSTENKVRVLGTQFERGSVEQPVDVPSCSGLSGGKTDEHANNCHDK